MDQVEKRLLGKRILSKKPIRTNYFDFNANDLPKEFLLWIDNVIEKGEELVRYGSESKYEYRAKIFDEIIMVCIRNLLPWTKLNDAKIVLLNLASMAVTCPPKVVPIVMLQIGIMPRPHFLYQV